MEGDLTRGNKRAGSQSYCAITMLNLHIFILLFLAPMNAGLKHMKDFAVQGK